MTIQEIVKARETGDRLPVGNRNQRDKRQSILRENNIGNVIRVSRFQFKGISRLQE